MLDEDLLVQIYSSHNYWTGMVVVRNIMNKNYTEYSDVNYDQDMQTKRLLIKKLCSQPCEGDPSNPQNNVLSNEVRVQQTKLVRN